MFFKKKNLKRKMDTIESVGRIIDEFQDIFSEFNPHFYKEPVRFQGKIEWNYVQHSFLELKISIICPITRLRRRTCLVINDRMSYHAIHFNVCQAIVSGIKDLEKDLEIRFEELMKDKKEEK
jgi:hypothetical protein